MSGNLTNLTNCLVAGCRHLTACNPVSGLCTCPYGLHGPQCELVWVSGHETTFAVFRYTLLALFALTVAACAGLFVEFWARRLVKFPRLNREQVGLVFFFRPVGSNV